MKIKDTQTYINEEKKVVTTVITSEIGDTFSAQSRCDERDEFNPSFGSKLSYLRAKKKMLNAYNRAQKDWYKTRIKNFEEWKQLTEKTISKNEKIINDIDTAINEMIAE